MTQIVATVLVIVLCIGSLVGAWGNLKAERSGIAHPAEGIGIFMIAIAVLLLLGAPLLSSVVDWWFPDASGIGQVEPGADR